MNSRRRQLKRRPWKGGHVHRQRDGRDLYVIERQVNGRRFHVSTRCHDLEAALEQLTRFEANPAAYEPIGVDDRDPLRLTAELVAEFRQWLLDRPRPTTKKYSNEMANRLTDWIEDLRGADLRQLELAKLKAIVDRRATNRQHRIIAIKTFCGWLRTEKYLLTRQNDVTMDLPVPQAIPEQWKRRKAAPLEHVRVVLRHLAPSHRDCLLLLAATGMHVTELARFATRPDSELLVDEGRSYLGRLVFRHKSGKPHVVAITDRSVLEAAQRVRERGAVPRRLNAAIKGAIAAANEQRAPEEQIAPFGAGKMRHSTGSWATDAEVSVERVGSLLGHADKRTTDRHYIDAAIPRVVLPMPKLT